MPNNRTFGNNIEVQYAKRFREEGFPKCKTTRETSRLLDACKVDLSGIPMNLQIKAGKQSSLSSAKVLQEIDQELAEHFPERLNLPKAVLHHFRGKRGKKRIDEDSLVTMTFEDFIKMFKLVNGK